MKASLLPRWRTPVTLTVEEPRKLCVLFIYSTTHTVNFTTRYQHEKLSCQWKAQRHKSGEALSTFHLCQLKSHRIKRYVYFSSFPTRQKRPTEFQWELKFTTTCSRYEIRKLVLDNWFPEIQKNLVRLGNPDRVFFDESRELPWILGCLRWWWQDWIHIVLPILYLHQPRCHL